MRAPLKGRIFVDRLHGSGENGVLIQAEGLDVFLELPKFQAVVLRDQLIGIYPHGGVKLIEVVDPAKYERPIRRGEYDLVNISLIGHDPNSGVSFEACNAAWQKQLTKLHTEEYTLRWWQVLRHLRLRWKAACLHSHMGM